VANLVNTGIRHSFFVMYSYVHKVVII